MTLSPVVLQGRDRYERLMEGWTDNLHAEALTHSVRLTDPDRAIELRVVALPPPRSRNRRSSP